METSYFHEEAATSLVVMVPDCHSVTQRTWVRFPLLFSPHESLVAWGARAPGQNCCRAPEKCLTLHETA